MNKHIIEKNYGKSSNTENDSYIKHNSAVQFCKCGLSATVGSRSRQTELKASLTERL
jgi:hypothetical protein